MARVRRSSPSHSQASSAPPPAHHHPSPQQQQHSHQASSAPQPPQVTNIYMQRGGAPGGGGSGILGTVASVAAGSVIGHGISHMLFNKDQPPAQPAQAQEVVQQVGNGACSSEIKSYSKCLEFNPDQSENCKWVWDQFVQCQSEKQQ